MGAHVTFDQQYWPLHLALAWVLTRDRVFCERVQSDFFPLLDRHGWKSYDEVDCAWSILHQSLADGRVPAFKVSIFCGNEERIAPEALASRNWADLTKDEYSVIVVCSMAMGSVFRSDGDPVAFTSVEPPIRPDGPGFMTLSAAAYWIATKGGTKRIIMRDLSVWEEVFNELLRHMQSGKVRVVGRRHGEDLPDVINAESFVGLRVDYPYVDTPITMIVGEEPHIKCYGVIPDSSADQGSDELWGSDRHGPEWSHLQVDRADVCKCWRFPKARNAVQHRVNDENQAIAVLAEALRENKDLTRREAKDLVGIGIGPCPFQNRVWPEARKLAGLKAIAPPGRKRKNRHA